MKPSIWGDIRTFKEGKNKVRAVPKLDAKKIEEIVITHMDGDRRELEVLVAKVKQTYTGALYSTWEQGMK